jgi:hypothetical protein
MQNLLSAKWSFIQNARTQVSPAGKPRLVGLAMIQKQITPLPLMVAQNTSTE